ncbi:MAG TPA: saccharopine dehydrogenase, partial [Anaerolineae bacterium]|nr:saccharopine dehydrogenase [Anaerolineae bacterium]
MNIVVLGGCGDMGSYVVRELLESSEATVTIADYREAEAKRLAAELGERAKGIFVDANNEDSLLLALRGADVAVGCIGPFYA